jgi:predicted cobalt transporter CbtA
MHSFGALLVRGLLAGLIAGLVAGAFAYVTGEPHIDAAIALEEQAAHSHGDAGGETAGREEEDPLVSRTGQRAGLFLATSLYGVAIGGIFATAYFLLRRRLRAHSDTAAVLGLAAAAFLGGVLVPFGKYPANPPAVGDPDTITQRTLSYLALLVLGLLAVWAGVAAFRTVRSGAPEWLRAAGGAAAFLLTVGVAYAALPTIEEVPAEFPASLLWEFRLASLGTQLVLWIGIGLAFAALVDRGANRATPPASAVSAGAARG